MIANIIRWSITNRLLILLLTILVCIWGVWSVKTLPVDAIPDLSDVQVIIKTSYPGQSPQVVEDQITYPISTSMLAVPGAVAVRGFSYYGDSYVYVIFSDNTDIYWARSRVLEYLNSAASKLPDDVQPTLGPDATGVGWVYQYALVDKSGNQSLADLRSLQDFNLRYALEAVEGVAEVASVGGFVKEYQINIDPNKLASYGIPLQKVTTAVRASNNDVGGRVLEIAGHEQFIRGRGYVKSVEDLKEVVIGVGDGGIPIRVADVATVSLGPALQRGQADLDGEGVTVGGIVIMRYGENALNVINRVKDRINILKTSLPPGVEIVPVYDRSSLIERAIDTLQNTLIQEMLIVSLVIGLFLLHVRSVIVAVVTLPIAILLSFIPMFYLGLTANIMSLGGIAITIGTMVDGAIVIVEYADRKISEGMERREAFIRAAKLMFWPIVSSTGTTLAAFLPMLLWPGIIGKFMSYLPIMVIITLIASLITAMVFLPVLGGLLARKKVSEKEMLAAQALSGRDNFDPKTVPGFTGGYVRFLNAIIRRPIMVLVVGVGMIVGIFMYFGQNSTGVEAFPSIEPEYATVAVTGRGNYSPIEIRDLLIEVETEVLKVKGIKEVVMNFGSTGAVSSPPPDTLGNLQLEFEPFSDRRYATEIFADIRENIKDIKGVGVELLEAEEGPPTGKDLSMRVTAQSYDDLAPTVAKIRNYVENDLGNMIEVEDGRPLPGIDWKINVNREMAALYGIGVRDLSPYVQLVTSGVAIGTYRPDDAIDELDIRVRLPKEQRSFEALDSLRIITNAGLVPVSNFITREAVPKVASISRRDSQYTMGVRANVSGEKEDGTPVMAAEKVEELKTWISAQTWPAGVEFEYAGADEQTNETNAFMMQAGGAAMFLMFLILLTQFNSFYQVAITLSTVVMSVAGVLLGMLITGQAFSAIMTGVGIVSLAGIVVNNSIVLIDTYNRFRHEGADPISASLMTASQRLRPVLLTTITTVFGLIPMALGITLDFFGQSIVIGDPSGAWWIQLATAVISGLTFSTLLTLIMVPVLLVAPSIWQSQLIWLWGMITYPFRAFAAWRRSKATAKAEAAEAAEAVDEEAMVTDQPAAAKIPANADSAKAYITGDLVTEERHGVTVVSRPTPEAAE